MIHRRRRVIVYMAVVSLVDMMGCMMHHPLLLTTAFPTKVNKGHSTAVYKMTATEDTHLLITADMFKEFRIWNTNTGKMEWVFQEFCSKRIQPPFSMPRINRVYDGPAVAISADGSLIAATSPANHIVRIWSAKDRRVEKRLNTRGKGILSLVFSRNGRVLYAGSDDGFHDGYRHGSILKWNLTHPRRAHNMGSQHGSVVWIGWAVTDQLLLSLHSSPRDKRYSALHAWRLEHGKAEHFSVRQGDGVKAVATIPNRGIIAAVKYNGEIVMWRVRDNILQIPQRLCQLSGQPRSIAISQDSQSIVVGMENGQCCLVTRNNGLRVKCWKAHDGPVRDMLYLTNGRIVTAGGSSTRPTFWDHIVDNKR